MTGGDDVLFVKQGNISNPKDFQDLRAGLHELVLALWTYTRQFDCFNGSLKHEG